MDQEIDHPLNINTKFNTFIQKKRTKNKKTPNNKSHDIKTKKFEKNENEDKKKIIENKKYSSEINIIDFSSKDKITQHEEKIKKNQKKNIFDCIVIDNKKKNYFIADNDNNNEKRKKFPFVTYLSKVEKKK